MNNTGYPSIDKTHEKNWGFFDKHPIIPNTSIYETLSLISSFYKDALAINCLDLQVSYVELFDVAKTLSKAYKELGVKPGEIITCCMPNYFQAVAAFLAANRVGAITSFLNPLSTEEEIIYNLNEFESPLFINYNKGFMENTRIKNDTKVRQIITLNKKDLNSKTLNHEKTGSVGYNDFISFSDIGVVADYYKNYINALKVSGNDDALLLFTSGSTGKSKIVTLTNKNVISSGIYMKNSTKTKLSVGEKCLVCVPFCYPYGFATSTLMSLLCGREAILCPDISKDNLLYFLDKQPNLVFGTPALLELIEKFVPENYDMESIHTFISGGAKLTANQNREGQRFFAEHGSKATIRNGSGNAENAGASTNAVGITNRPETAGQVLKGTKCMVINPDTMEEVKYGEEGELCIAGKHVFKEYYNNEELTEKAFFNHNGIKYLRTGTIGILDEDGYFTITGRPRYYITGDKSVKVYLGNIERIASNIPEIDTCVACQKPTSDGRLYVTKLFITLAKDVDPTEETINLINEKLKLPYMDEQGKQIQLKDVELPESITILDEMPMNLADKIDVKKLDEMAIEEYTNEEKVKRSVR